MSFQTTGCYVHYAAVRISPTARKYPPQTTSRTTKLIGSWRIMSGNNQNFFYGKGASYLVTFVASQIGNIIALCSFRKSAHPYSLQLWND